MMATQSRQAFLPTLTSVRNVDFKRKLFIQSGRFELDGAAHWFRVGYDPLLERDTALVEQPQKEQDTIGMPLRDPDHVISKVPFGSNRGIRLFDLIVYESEPIRGTLDLRLAQDASSFDLNRTIVSKHLGLGCGQAGDLIKSIIEHLSEWYANNEDLGYFKAAQQIFRVEEAVYNHFCPNVRHPPAADASGYVTFDRRMTAFGRIAGISG